LHRRGRRPPFTNATARIAVDLLLTAEKQGGLAQVGSRESFKNALCNGTSLLGSEPGEFYQHLTDVYRRRARLCVMMISADYGKKLWPTVEREAAVARAVSGNVDYLLPLRLDDTVVPGLQATLVYVDIRSRTLGNVCDLIVKRVRLTG
jgi:hypothetical protein